MIWRILKKTASDLGLVLFFIVALLAGVTFAFGLIAIMIWAMDAGGILGFTFFWLLILLVASLTNSIYQELK